MALWLPKWMRDEDAPPEIESRRTFLFMGAAAGVVLVAEPVRLFDLGDIPKAIAKGPLLTLEEMNRIIRELYTPVAVKNLNDNGMHLKHPVKANARCPYCEAGLDTNADRCWKCRAQLRQVDVRLPEELVKDMEFLRALAKES